jgi:hypothetical protein
MGPRAVLDAVMKRKISSPRRESKRIHFIGITCHFMSASNKKRNGGIFSTLYTLCSKTHFFKFTNTDKLVHRLKFKQIKFRRKRKGNPVMW